MYIYVQYNYLAREHCCHLIMNNCSSEKKDQISQNAIDWPLWKGTIFCAAYWAMNSTVSAIEGCSLGRGVLRDLPLLLMPLSRFPDVCKT